VDSLGANSGTVHTVMVRGAAVAGIVLAGVCVCVGPAVGVSTGAKGVEVALSGRGSAGAAHPTASRSANIIPMKMKRAMNVEPTVLMDVRPILKLSSPFTAGRFCYPRHAVIL